MCRATAGTSSVTGTLHSSGSEHELDDDGKLGGGPNIVVYVNSDILLTERNLGVVKRWVRT